MSIILTLSCSNGKPKGYHLYRYWDSNPDGRNAQRIFLLLYVAIAKMLQSYFSCYCLKPCAAFILTRWLYSLPHILLQSGLCYNHIRNLARISQYKECVYSIEMPLHNSSSGNLHNGIFLTQDVGIQSLHIYELYSSLPTIFIWCLSYLEYKFNLARYCPSTLLISRQQLHSYFTRMFTELAHFYIGISRLCTHFLLSITNFPMIKVRFISNSILLISIIFCQSMAIWTQNLEILQSIISMFSIYVMQL